MTRITTRHLGFAAGLATLAAASPVAATDLPPAPEEALYDPQPTVEPDRFTLTATGVLATDRFERGLTRTEHGFYAETRLTATSGMVRGELAAITAGNDPDVGFNARIAVAPRFEAVALDLSVARTHVPGYERDEAWTFALGAEVAVTDALTARSGLVFDLFDARQDRTGVTVGGDYRFDGGVSANATLTYERETGDSLTYGGGVSVPVTDTVSVGGGLAYRQQFSGPQSYAYWDAGITWTPTDWATVDVRYHGNTLSDDGCATHAASSCDERVLATLTLSGDVMDVLGGE
ncbi:hypothetical protein [Chthonobacter rhizosphaerae]|uniref:hypothetical protein n=1 Tax=Chthonobacter rhizosphaerae TaxID=2735553 RepID=UPI0015EF0351|nr:hypothetical protein [Chthonobacter rhizosphaerae]